MRINATKKDAACRAEPAIKRALRPVQQIPGKTAILSEEEDKIDRNLIRLRRKMSISEQAYELLGVPARIGRPPKVSDEEITRIYTLRVDGRTTSTVEGGRMLSVSQSTVSRRLKRLNYHAYGNRYTRRRLSDEYAILLYEQGISSIEAGAKAKVHAVSMLKRWRKLGFKPHNNTGPRRSESQPEEGKVQYLDQYAYLKKDIDILIWRAKKMKFNAKLLKIQYPQFSIDAINRVLNKHQDIERARSILANLSESGSVTFSRGYAAPL